MSAAKPARKFPTTHWTLICESRGENSRRALEELSRSSRGALEELCRLYWRPLFWFLRAEGYDADDASDLVQGYFAILLEKDYVGDFDPDRGRFRTFLIRSMKNFSSKQLDYARALKRGGGKVIESLDVEGASEPEFELAVSHGVTPELLFERAWAATVVEEARQRLFHEYERAGRQSVFEVLSAFIDPHEAPPAGREVARRLGLAETSVKVTVHRFRRRFRRHVEEVLSDTVSDQASLHSEVVHLIEVLGR